MDDAQLDMMLGMLTPEMMRMSMNFAKSNPDLVQQQMAGGAAARPAAAPTAPSDSTSQ